MTSLYLPSDYEGGPALPLVPQVEYPTDHATDDRLYAASRAASAAKNLRAELEARLELAHRAMVRRDALLTGLVASVQQGDGDMVLFRAPIYAYWHDSLERDVKEATRMAGRLAERPDREAER